MLITNTPVYDASFPKPEQIESLFQWMPTCGIVIDKSGNIVDVNKNALAFFRLQGNADPNQIRHLSDIVVDLPRAMEFIAELFKSKKPTDRKALLRRQDNSIVYVDIIACVFPNKQNFILFQFSETSQQNQTLLTQLIKSFRLEIASLKPYLNKPGKEILQQIIKDDILEGIVNNKSTQSIQLEVVRDERISQLMRMFPELTNGELALCGFLSLRMTMDEIAGVTSKTPNSLRVTFHRIVRKLNLNSGKELIKRLETIQ